MQDILDWLTGIAPELTAIRRGINPRPELGVDERPHGKSGGRQARAWGIETTEGVGGTGVVGTI